MFQKLTKILAPVAAAVLLVALPALAVAQTSEQGKTNSGMQDESGTMMTGHMAQHMKSGDKRSMSECPMMKSMRGDGEMGEPEGESRDADHH